MYPLNDFRPARHLAGGKNAPAVLVLLLTALAPAAQAEVDQWRYCGPAPQPVPFSPSPANAPMAFTADRAEAQKDIYRLQGHVSGRRGAETISAERLDYDAARDEVQAEGGVHFARGSQLLWGERAVISLRNDRGEISPARFWLLDKHLRGDAESLYLRGPKRLQLDKTLFTTCDEGDEFWRLRAASLTLDEEDNVGIARHARLELLQVPVFYTPYLSFPLQGRKSGLLVPTIGDNSRSGIDFSQPIYWNIAPDRDATLTPRYMSKRGVLWGGEYRYLNAHSAGQLNLAYLPGDRIYGEDRSELAFQHQGDPAPGWRTGIDFHRVSDGGYLNDFGGQLSTTSITHLERRADLSYRGDHWFAAALVQNYQTLDETLPLISRPYARLPQLQLGLQSLALAGGLSLDGHAELVRFEREMGVVGTRLDIQPNLSLPLEAAAGFVRPQVGLRHTRYRLQHSAADAASPSRSLPIFSLDSGLFFERELDGAGRASLQTLEPRLFYLYVPYREQSELIVDEDGVSRVFDTSLPLFSLGQLFRDNRFNGADRVGDANQLSALLTTRFLDAAGRELASAALGRILYFRDRGVTLPGQKVETQDTSNWLGEVSTHWTSPFSSRLSIEWDEAAKELARSSLTLRYHPSPRQALNLGYLFERERLQQTDISLMWPLWRGLSLVGRRRYSIQDDLFLETVAGFEYESCCWVFRALRRRYRVDVLDEELSDTFWLQLELKGLSSVGRHVETLLERDILAP